jgi:hypothetical protein
MYGIFSVHPRDCGKSLIESLPIPGSLVMAQALPRASQAGDTDDSAEDH